MPSNFIGQQHSARSHNRHGESRTNTTTSHVSSIFQSISPISPSPLIAPSPLQKSCCNLARLQSSPSASHPCLLHTATAAAACNSRAKQAAITLITTAGRGEDKGNRRPDARPRPSFRHGSRCLFYQAPLRIQAKLLLQLPDAAPVSLQATSV